MGPRSTYTAAVSVTLALLVAVAAVCAVGVQVPTLTAGSQDAGSFRRVTVDLDPLVASAATPKRHQAPAVATTVGITPVLVEPVSRASVSTPLLALRASDAHFTRPLRI